MECSGKKIFICALAGIGHLNPIICVASELVKRKHKVIIFGEEIFRNYIEKSNAEFRSYSVKFNDTKFDPKNAEDVLGMMLFFKRSIEVAQDDVAYMLKQVEDEKPDLIIYDQFSFTAKYLFKLMENNYKKSVSSLKPPQGICFYTCFAMKPNIYPLDQYAKKLLLTDYLNHYFAFEILEEQSKLNLKYGIDVLNPFDLAYSYTADINIVSCFPELQPMSDAFGPSFNFVGCCLSNEARKYDLDDLKLINVLESYKPINPNLSSSSILDKAKKKLVYASLGTLFNFEVSVFEKIINAVKLLNEEGHEYKENIEYIIACGKFSLDYLKKKEKNENFLISDNIVLLDYAPQIEVLERASLFITHAGMNSTSEAIHYAVPVICTPLKADQPLCAIRLADDLKLGKRVDPETFTSEELKNLVKEILNDPLYFKRMADFSKISRKYNGTINAADTIEKCFINS